MTATMTSVTRPPSLPELLFYPGGSTCSQHIQTDRQTGSIIRTVVPTCGVPGGMVLAYQVHSIYKPVNISFEVDIIYSRWY